MYKNVQAILISFFIFVVTFPPTFAQETVNNPGEVMDLLWEIGSWQTLWQTEEFYSESLDEKVGYYLYLPPGYNEQEEQRYPVLIWLHGAYGRPHSASPVVSRLDNAIRNGSAPPMIVVSVLDPTGLSMWTDSKDGRLPMEAIITKELIPHVDNTYRSMATRSGRAIEGFSMGGYGAAYLGFKYHELFSSVSMLAAALHTPETFENRRRAIFDNVFGGDADYASERSPWEWVEKNSQQIRGNTKVRIFVGADDGLLAWDTNYHELLNTLDIDHEWGVVPDSPHDISLIMQNWQGDFFSYYRELFGRNGGGDDEIR